jgi:hypothetical protein
MGCCHGNLEALYVALSCVPVRHPHGSTTRFVISIVRSWTAQPCRTWNIDTHCKWCLMFSLSDQLSSSRWTSSQGGISCVCFVPNDLIRCAWSKKQCKTHSVCWALPPQGQWLTHSIQLFGFLHYWNRFFWVKVFRLFRLKRIFFGV